MGANFSSDEESALVICEKLFAELSLGVGKNSSSDSLAINVPMNEILMMNGSLGKLTLEKERKVEIQSRDGKSKREATKKRKQKVRRQKKKKLTDYEKVIHNVVLDIFSNIKTIYCVQFY